MAPNQKISNQKGQALLETLLALPVYALLVSGCLGGAYLAMALQWTDHWVYRANICLVEGTNSHHCREQLIKRLNLVIPLKCFEVKSLWKTPQRTECSVDLHFGSFFRKTLTSRVPLPLK